MKTITNFSKINTIEGTRISYTYSEINEKGQLVSQNNKGSFVVVDKEILNHLTAIETFINNVFLSE